MQDTARDDEPPATQYEIMRDGGFKHLDHADEDDRRATQRLQHRAQSNRKQAANQAAENGILLSIHCVNFMCHSSLNIQLGPLLNFIVGENGSGKSAILTAITLCLGGKASSTNRGGNMKAFIKEGQYEARLIVKIKNEGDDAYQRDIYGDFIHVERRFNRKGAGSFRLCSAAGRVISTKKQDITDIVEYYCLQVDNPLNVLSQDNARQFLNQATAKQKYKFFLQGVQLQQLDDDYRLVEEYVNAIEHKTDLLEASLEASKQDFERAKKDYNIYMESEKMRQQRQLLVHKLAWTQVTDLERKIAEHTQNLVECDGNIADRKRIADEKAQELELAERKIGQAERDVEAVKEEAASLQDNLDKAQKEFNDAKGDLSKLTQDERDAHSRLGAASDSVKEYEKKISEEEQRLQALNGDAVTQKNQEHEAARGRRSQFEKESHDLQQRIPELNGEMEKANGELRTIDLLMTQKKGEIQAAQKRIKELEQGQGSLYDAYVPQIPQLLRMITADAGFEQKPVGPMGAHIQVLQPIWSPMLERMFGDALNGFVVTSKRDQLRLRRMMDQLKITSSPIFIGNPRPIDTSNFEPDENFDTVLRILKIDSALVRNQFIINQRIERTILVPDQDDAERIMLTSAPPRNVNTCYHLFPEKGHGWTVRLTANANGISSSAQNPHSGSQQKPRLKSDSLQETSLHKERLGHLQEEMKNLQNQKQAQQQALGGFRKELMEIKKNVDRNKQRIREVQVEIGDIQAELDSFEGVDGRLEGLRADLSKAQEDFDHYGNSYGSVQLRRKEHNQLCESLLNKVKAERAKLDEFKPRLKEAEGKVMRATDVRQILVQEKNEAYDQHTMAENDKARQENRCAELQERLLRFVEAAEKICQRVHIGDGETYDTIAKKMESLEKMLKQRERRRGVSDQEVKRRLEETKAGVEDLQNSYAQVQIENKAWKKVMESRLAKWRMFQRYISSNSRANFMYLLSERDFRGKLILEHKKHTLEVQVEPDKTRKNAAARNTKTLSGGEKSFSSICLLLAIWEAMGSPLRCLDEFDVFMDNVNRAISTNMLVGGTLVPASSRRMSR